MSFAVAAIWALGALFLHIFLLGATEATREGAFFDLVSRTGCQALAYALVLFGILRVHEPDASIRDVLALRRTSVLAIVLALALGAALALPSDWLDRALEVRFPRAPEEQQALDRLLSVATPVRRASLVLTLVIVQPALDELFFRGALFTPLRRSHRVGLVVLATAAFETLGSLSPRAVFTLMMATLVFSWLRGVTGSAVPSIVARASFYGVSVIPMALGREPPSPTRALLLASVGVGVSALAGVYLLARQSTRLADARLEDGP